MCFLTVLEARSGRSGRWQCPFPEALPALACRWPLLPESSRHLSCAHTQQRCVASFLKAKASLDQGPALMTSLNLSYLLRPHLQVLSHGKGWYSCIHNTYCIPVNRKNVFQTNPGFGVKHNTLRHQAWCGMGQQPREKLTRKGWLKLSEVARLSYRRDKFTAWWVLGLRRHRGASRETKAASICRLEY